MRGMTQMGHTNRQIMKHNTEQYRVISTKTKARKQYIYSTVYTQVSVQGRYSYSTVSFQWCTHQILCNS